MQPKTKSFEVFSLAKGGWKGNRKFSKNLSLEPNGIITIYWETEEEKEVFSLSEVHQIIWSDISQTSNPQVAFTFKDEKRFSLDVIYFEQEEACKQFLDTALEID